jgi:hypothetical protein
MKEFNSMSELMLYMLRSNIPEKLKSSVSERMQAVEECNDGGASAVLIIAHSKAEVEEVEKRYSISSLTPEVDEYINTLDGAFWRGRIYVLSDDGSGIIYYERVPLL